MAEKQIPYTLIRSSRKTIAIQIKGGQVIVRCPARMKTADIQRFVTSKTEWIEKHLESKPLPAAPFTQAQLQELAARAKILIPERTAYFAARIGVTYGRITIRAQHTRWGSCSSKGNLNFNCLLALVPPQVLDYVIVHELCHRIELNHSARFWALVEKVLPDHRVHRAWLKEHGSRLIGRLP